MLRNDEIHRIRQQLLALQVQDQVGLWRISRDCGLAKELIDGFIAGAEIHQDDVLRVHSYLHEYARVQKMYDERAGEPTAQLSWRERFRFLAQQMRLMELREPLPIHVWLRKIPSRQADILLEMDDSCKREFMRRHGTELRHLRVKLLDRLSFRQWLLRYKQAKERL